MFTQIYIIKGIKLEQRLHLFFTILLRLVLLQNTSNSTDVSHDKMADE